MTSDSSMLNQIGQAPVILVYPKLGHPTVVITRVRAEISAQTESNTIEATFVGPCVPEQAVQDHVQNTICPILDRTLGHIGIPRQRIILSLVNLGAASGSDRLTTISGFSADLPFFLAMLSAFLGVPLRNKVAATGHIASTGGELRLVQHLPQKIEAVANSDQFQEFVCPSPDHDASVDALQPGLRRALQPVMARTKHDCRIVHVQTVSDAVAYVISESSLVTAALDHDYFNKTRESDTWNGSNTELTWLLVGDLEQRYWRAVQVHLTQGRIAEASVLLTSRMRYQIRRQEYPDRFGARISAALAAMPAPFRRQLRRQSLVDVKLAAKMGVLADGPNERDFEKLLAINEVARGNTPERQQATPPPPEFPDKLDWILGQLSEDAITRVTSPIDLARASYPLERVTVSSSEEFYDTIAAFYAHVMNHLGVFFDTSPEKAYAQKALDVIGRLPSADGGSQSIDDLLDQAHTGRASGLRDILDRMTTVMRQDRIGEHVRYVMANAIDSKDPEERAAFTRALIERAGPGTFPAEVVAHPERYERHYHELVMAYTGHMDHLKATVRRLG